MIETHIIHPQLVDTEKYLHLLDEQEMTKSMVFHSEKDRFLYRSSHIFLRTILSKNASVSPKKWIFTHNKYGKPQVCNEGYEWLSFNLSHTHSMIMCAVGHQYDIGVDIEHYRPLDDLLGLSQLTLCSSEQEHIFSSHDLRQREVLFYRYWTLKEACIKALGKGLSMPLKNIEYQLKDDEPWTCHINPLPDNRTQIYSFSYAMDNKYALAMAIELPRVVSPPLICMTNWNIPSKEPKFFTFNISPKDNNSNSTPTS